MGAPRTGRHGECPRNLVSQAMAAGVSGMPCFFRVWVTESRLHL